MIATHPIQSRHQTWLLVISSMNNRAEEKNKSYGRNSVSSPDLIQRHSIDFKLVSIGEDG
jgi:hypothetical protein